MRDVASAAVLAARVAAVLAARVAAPLAGLVTALMAAAPRVADAQGAAVDGAVAPFSARYEAYWKNINVGYSEIEFKRDVARTEYRYVWSINARGVFKLLYASAVTQTSWMSITDGQVRPLRYLGVEGSSSVALTFDWRNGRARGTSENRAVDFAIDAGVQDFNSIQVQVMLDLRNGNLPKTFQIVDKDQLKVFNYTAQGTASLATALGPLETLVVASQRTGNNRILTMWFAPSLDFIPVQAERSRDGKLEFAMRIASFKR